MAEEEEPSIEEILASIRQIISDDDEDGAEGADGEAAPAEEAPAAEAAPQDEAPQDDDPMAAAMEEMAADEVATEESVIVPDATEAPPAEAAPAEQAAADDVFELTEVVEEGEAPAEALDQSKDDVDSLLTDMGVDVGEKPDIDFDDTESVVDEAPAEELEAVDPFADADMPAEEPAMDDFVMPEDVGEVEGSDLMGDVTAAATVTGMAMLAENIALARTKQGVTLEDIVRDMLQPMLREWIDTNLPPLIERLVKEELEKLAEKAMKK